MSLVVRGDDFITFSISSLVVLPFTFQKFAILMTISSSKRDLTRSFGVLIKLVSIKISP